MAGHHRHVRDLPQPSPSGLFFPDGRSTVSGNGRHAPILGQSPSLCVPSIRLHSSGPRQSPTLAEPRDDAHSSFLAPEALVSRSLGAPSGSSCPSVYAEGSTQTAPLPSLSSEPPRATVDWFSYCERSARSLGFSSRVARQLAFCRRSSTLINYQAKWVTYRSWCRAHGHSISCPSVPKIADFLLYLRCSLHLSYSSIASYRSVLSTVFRFVLPEISSYPVLHDLLHSFRIERPLPSSRAPPWDLLRVLSLLWGPPFEPLTSCSLRDLSRKVLFLVSLATAHRVGELQAVSASVSFSGDDIFLLYLPDFRAKSESTSNPLPRCFRVRSLRDFVGNLPDKLLLCPARTLQVYLDRTSSLSPRPRSLFVSPCVPTRPLSKNALSVFLRSVILQSLPSTSSSFPSSSSSNHLLSGPIASVVWPLLLLSIIMSLSSILEAATWSSSSVFTSSCLHGIQFSSGIGFSLGPVVVAGAVM